MPDRFYFDFVDPLSYVLELTLADLEAAGTARFERVGYELNPPPAPLGRRSDRRWLARLEAAAQAAPVLTLDSPSVVPWTRKAHELHAHARERGVDGIVRRALFDAYFGHGRDIGRIDELVSIAEAAGLDRLDARVALDLDSRLDDVVDARREAERLGVTDVPTMLVAGTLIEGFHNLTDLSTLLGGPPHGRR